MVTGLVTVTRIPQPLHSSSCNPSSSDPDLLRPWIHVVNIWLHFRYTCLFIHVYTYTHLNSPPVDAFSRLFCVYVYACIHKHVHIYVRTGLHKADILQTGLRVILDPEKERKPEQERKKERKPEKERKRKEREKERKSRSFE